MKPIENINFEVTISPDLTTGRILAVYFRIRRGKVAQTREFAEGNAFADYDRRGRLLGVEILGPCEVTVLNKITHGERAPVKQFLQNSIPRGMVLQPA
jgi:uncharacterized protein YuzE